MSSLDTLIKLHRWQVDERRRQVAACETLVATLRAERERLEAEKAAEQDIAGNNPEAAYAYSGYAKSVIERRAKLGQSIAEAEEQLTQARATLAEAFAEVKRYEIAAANRLLAKHRRLEQLNQQQLDEVAIERFRRKEAAT
jgi:flagellar protein FliJ